LKLLGVLNKKVISQNEQNIIGMKFRNKLGTAAGLDKNGDYIDALGALGFGFLEVGTVTPKPQYGNPKPRIFRNYSENSIINRLGFNNKGIDYLVNNLKKRKYEGWS
jgi:dihydroorotate dehydrogenase